MRKYKALLKNILNNHRYNNSAIPLQPTPLPIRKKNMCSMVLNEVTIPLLSSLQGRPITITTLPQYCSKIGEPVYQIPLVPGIQSLSTI